MRKKSWLMLVSAIMCIVLLAGCSLPFGLGGSGTSSDERRTIPYSEMVYERPDAEGIKTRLVELADLIIAAKSYNELLKYDNEAGELLEDFYTMRTLAMLQNYHDTSDSYYEEEYRYCDDAAVEIGNALTKMNAAIVEGPYAEDYRKDVGDYVFQSIVNDLLLNSDSVEDFKKERNQLNIDYNNHLTNLTLSYEGKEYTMDDITDLYYSDGYSTYIKYYTLYYKENAQIFTEYYSKMIELDKKTARELGFASPVEMYYLTFSRDYTPEDALQFCQNSKETIVPLVEPLTNIYYNEIETSPTPLSLSRTMKAIPKALAEIDDELVQAWDHMVNNELYDYESAPNKQGGAFTTTISKYDAPFCFGNWTDDFGSTTTMVHEFGHYYDDWLRYNVSTVFNLDIAEVYSQGLEVLVQEQYSMLLEIPGEIEDARLGGLYDFINPLTFQLALEVFQQRVYALDTFDADVIAQIYAEVLAEYGCSDYGIVDENGRDYSWFRVTHLFDAPFYTVSYATSAMVALQIWSAAQEDYSTGVQLYLDMIHADQNQPFVELVQSIGLEDPFSKRAMSKVADDMMEAFGLTAQDLPAAA